MEKIECQKCGCTTAFKWSNTDIENDKDTVTYYCNNCNASFELPK